MGKHKTIWEYLTAKRNGIEFLMGDEKILTGISKSEASFIQPQSNLRDIRSYFKSKAVSYDKNTFQELLTKFVVTNDQSFYVFMYIFFF